MSTVIVYDGVNYNIPSTDDVDWGDEVTKFLVAIPNGMLTKSGGAWHLTDADLDLGSLYGLASLYYKTKTATPALSGVLRLASGDFIAWRNTANSGDVKLAKSAGNFLTWNDIDLVDLSTGQTLTNKIIDAVDNTITRIKNVNIASDAAIEWSKIAFSGDFGSTSVITTGGVKLGSDFHVTLQADPSEDYDFVFPATDGTTGQALVKSSTGELEWATVPGLALNHNSIIVGDPANLPANPDTSAVGDVLADDVDGLTIKSDIIVDAMIKSDAAIALSKLAALTASRAVVTDASGLVAVSTVTAAELGWVSGVTSGIQAQINTITGNITTLQTILDGGTASSTVRVTMPQDTLANLAALPRKAGTTYYATDTKKFYLDDGAALKIVGGGLVPTNITVSGTTPSIATLESGKHYIYNGAGASGDVTVTMPAVAAESDIRITVYNIPTTRKLIVSRAGSDNFRKDDTLYTTVEFLAVEVEQSAEFLAATDANEWLVDDGSNALGTTWGGALTVTGAFTPQGGIVGKTDGVAVAAGYVGEILGTETAYTNLKGYNYYSEIKCNNSTTLLSISVSKGLYLVNVACMCATGAVSRGMSVKLTDASDTTITAVTQSGSGPITAYDYLTGSFSIPLLITSNTTLYVKGSCYNSTDGGTLEARLTFTRANLIRFM